MKARFLLYACCVIFTALPARPAFAASTPAFWKVSEGKATVYLLGSMHFGHPDFYPLPEEVEAAYSEAAALAVEVDMAKVTPAMAAAAVRRYGRLPEGSTLAQSLSHKVHQDLVVKAGQAGLPLAAFDQFQPWFVALQMIAAEIRKTPLQQDLGVDLYFINRGGKPVEQLETLDQQLALFGSLTPAEQEVFLEQTLADMSNSHRYLSSMAEAWRRGDIEYLERSLINPFKEDAATARLFHKVFTERNHQMSAAVIRYLREGRDVFFVVGVGHLLGEQGVVAQLREHGAIVQRVHFGQ